MRASDGAPAEERLNGLRGRGTPGVPSRPVSVRVGFLGAGLIATYHSKSLHVAEADVAWAGVYDPDGERARQFAAASGATACGSEEEVLDCCDVVYVCTWTAEHPRLVAAAAERGLAVFCEKPLGVDLAAATGDGRPRSSGPGSSTRSGLVLRHSPAFGMLKALAEDPSSGRPMSVVFRDDQFIPIQGSYRSTLAGRRDEGGGGHPARALDPRPRHARARARAGRPACRPRTAAFHEIDGIEDVASVLLRFAKRRHRHAAVGVARRARTPEPAPGRVVLRAGLRRARGRLVRSGRMVDAPARHRHGSRAPT